MKAEYQVGDLLCRCVDENDMYIITRNPVKDGRLQDLYLVASMRTYKFYGYSKEGIDSLFCKVV